MKCFFGVDESMMIRIRQSNLYQTTEFYFSFSHFSIFILFLHGFHLAIQYSFSFILFFYLKKKNHMMQNNMECVDDMTNSREKKCCRSKTLCYIINYERVIFCLSFLLFFRIISFADAIIQIRQHYLSFC